jgi:hypothetical protein
MLSFGCTMQSMASSHKKVQFKPSVMLARSCGRANGNNSLDEAQVHDCPVVSIKGLCRPYPLILNWEQPENHKDAHVVFVRTVGKARTIEWSRLINNL